MTSSPVFIPNLTGIDYAKYFACGALACVATHGAATPIDVVKTTVQVDPKYKGMGLVGGGRKLVAERGLRVLATGFGATAVGYFVQGGAKFAGYEYWKLQLVKWSGGPEKAVENRTMIYLAGATIAEFFADILLTPLEATRIRLVSDSNYASGLPSAFVKMAKTEGLAGFYSGFIPIVFKQVPYAVGQFTINEWALEKIYKYLPYKKEDLSGLGKTGVLLGAGLTAGVGASLLSQPGDTVLSLVNKGGGDPKAGMMSRMSTIIRNAGVRGLFAGAGPRVVMTSFLVMGQFLIYGYVKEAMGARPGIEIHKTE